MKSIAESRNDIKQAVSKAIDQLIDSFLVSLKATGVTLSNEDEWTLFNTLISQTGDATVNTINMLADNMKANLKDKKSIYDIDLLDVYGKLKIKKYFKGGKHE